jgi:predicted DNA-binding antitoxin AbrB/MazE fold protein
MDVQAKSIHGGKMGVIEVVYENGVLKPLKKLTLPEKKRVKIIILDEFIRDLNDVFGLFEEDIDLEKLRKEWDRDVSSRH